MSASRPAMWAKASESRFSSLLEAGTGRPVSKSPAATASAARASCSIGALTCRIRVHDATPAASRAVTVAAVNDTVRDERKASSACRRTGADVTPTRER